MWDKNQVWILAGSYLIVIVRLNLLWNQIWINQILRWINQNIPPNSWNDIPWRQPSLPRAGAYSNGLRDAEEARNDPVHPQESHRFAPVYPLLSRMFAEKSGIFAEKYGPCPLVSSRNTEPFLVCGIIRYASQAAFRSSYASESPFFDKN